MNNEIMHIRDPLGHEIQLPGHLESLQFDDNPGDVYDDVAAVIQSPALIIRVDRGGIAELNYYRSVGWKLTLLIVVVPEHHQWRAVRCIPNPPSENITRLMAEGEVIYGHR